MAECEFVGGVGGVGVGDVDGVGDVMDEGDTGDTEYDLYPTSITVNQNMIKLFKLCTIIYKHLTSTPNVKSEVDRFLEKVTVFKLMIERGIKPDNIYMSYNFEIYTLTSLGKMLG